MYKVDLYVRVRRACMVEGMSTREAARVFGLHRDTVRKMLEYSVPPGYRRQSPPRRPKLDPYRGAIDRILEDDRSLPKKQRHTAKRIYERLRAEHGFTGKYTIVKDYVRERRRRTREMYVPLSHPPGDAQCDFGQAKAVIGGVEQTVHYFVLDLPHLSLFNPPPSTLHMRIMSARTISWPTPGDGRLYSCSLASLLPIRVRKPSVFNHLSGAVVHRHLRSAGSSGHSCSQAMGGQGVEASRGWRVADGVRFPAHRGHIRLFPELVTADPEPGEERAYGDAFP